MNHASPKTQGFGFNLRSPLALEGDDPLDGETPTGRIQFKPYSIDTAFGWWMPQAYARNISEKVGQDEVARERRLAEIGDALRSTRGETSVRDAFLAHVQSMQEFLDSHEIDAKPVSDREERFERFLSSRVKAEIVRDGSLVDPYEEVQ